MSKNQNQAASSSPGNQAARETPAPTAYPYQQQQQQMPNYSSMQQGQIPYYPQQTPPTVSGGTLGTGTPGMLPVEQSYVENILRLNRDKLATVYMTFENNERWNAKVFKGVIEAAGRDHLILRDPENNRRYLLLMVYLDYVTFDEPLNYSYPYAIPSGQMATYPPR